MNNPNLDLALGDLSEAIRGIALGSVESVVIEVAGRELIKNWNDHNPEDPIDEAVELANWE